MRDSNSQIGASHLPSLLALRCFEAAARAESFTSAAKELHLTHGAISRAVRLLEEDLGVTLFERRNRRVFLTDQGQKLFQGVSEGLGVIRRVTQELRKAAQTSPLVVSCEPTLLMRWLIPRWPEFRKQYPEHDVHLVAGGGPFKFESGIDLAIRRNDFKWPEALNVTYLFAEKTGPVCRPDKVNTFFDTSGEVPVLRPGAPRLQSRTRPTAWQEWLSVSGHVPLEGYGGPDQFFEHFYFSLQAALAGLGVAIAPCKMVQDDLEAGLLVAPLGFSEDGTSYHLLAPQEAAPGSAHFFLQEWLKSLAADKT